MCEPGLRGEQALLSLSFASRYVPCGAASVQCGNDKERAAASRRPSSLPHGICRRRGAVAPPWAPFLPPSMLRSRPLAWGTYTSRTSEAMPRVNL